MSCEFDKYAIEALCKCMFTGFHHPKQLHVAQGAYCTFALPAIELHNVLHIKSIFKAQTKGTNCTCQSRQLVLATQFGSYLLLTGHAIAIFAVINSSTLTLSRPAT